MIPVVGYVIRAGVGESAISGPQRVLTVSIAGDAVWLINLTESTFPGLANRHYARAPCRYAISDISSAIERGQLVMEDVPLPGSWLMTDQGYLDSAPSMSERKRRASRQMKRNARWIVVEAILGTQVDGEIVPVAYILREKILAVAKEYHLSVPTIYSWIHRYWAGRGCLNSLLPETSRCGNPGQRKATSGRRPGRKSRLAKAGLIETDGYILRKGDREHLTQGYALVKPGKTVTDAYLLTMGAFWSLTTQDERGQLKRTLFPIHERPTQPQFEYWGRELHGDPLRRRILGIDRWATSTLAVTGSTQDQVHAVGQVGMIDSTSTDIYLVSMLTRLKVLPPMHRTIVKDVRSTLLLGFYLGWEAPSSRTSLEAILSAASDKCEIAARFGIDLEQDLWPGMLPRHFVADNGEMKSKAMMEAERQFRFGIEFVKAYSGQSKSQVENQHHTDHKALDHKLPGTTRGKQRERGEQPPATKALWNYYEYVREFILAALAYNNEEVPNLAPTDMRIAGVVPTRLNIFRWLRDHNMRADIPCDLNLLRVFTLPDRDAILRRDGIYLLMDDGTKELPGHRFFTDELTRDYRWQQVARSGGGVKVTVKLDAQDLCNLWLPTADGPVKVPNVLAEQNLLEGLTLVDWLDHQYREDLRTDQMRQTTDQEGLDTLVRRAGITQQAATEKAVEESKLAKKRSKKAVPANLRQNREDEQNYINAQTAPQVVAVAASDGTRFDTHAQDAAARAMKTFHDRRAS